MLLSMCRCCYALSKIVLKKKKAKLFLENAKVPVWFGGQVVLKHRWKKKYSVVEGRLCGLRLRSSLYIFCLCSFCLRKIKNGLKRSWERKQSMARAKTKKTKVMRCFSSSWLFFFLSLKIGWKTLAKKSSQPRNSWRAGTLFDHHMHGMSCDIDFDATRARDTRIVGRVDIQPKSIFHDIAWSNCVPAAHEVLGWNTFFGQGSTTIQRVCPWTWKVRSPWTTMIELSASRGKLAV